MTILSLFATIAYTSHSSGFSMGNVSLRYWIIIGATILVSWIVSGIMKSRFKEFQQISIPLTGAEIAKRMLAENGITDVQVNCVEGMLSDHYDPTQKTVNLSNDVFYGNNISAAAVAAHECGHAVQHAQAYHWLALRSTMVPVTQFSSWLAPFVIMIGIVLAAMGNSPWIFLAGIILFGITTIFSLVTLPVEFDASRRAIEWLQNSSAGTFMHISQAKSALFWAAMTYVVGALSSIAMLAHYVLIFLNSRNNRD